jgi:hypothetical protein
MGVAARAIYDVNYFPFFVCVCSTFYVFVWSVKISYPWIIFVASQFNSLSKFIVRLQNPK